VTGVQTCALPICFAEELGDVKAAIKAQSAKWAKAWNAVDVDALMELYADEVKVLDVEAGIVEDKEVLRRVLGQEMEAEKDYTTKLEIRDVLSDGKYANQYGTWELIENKNGKQVEEGVFMALWVQKGAEWKILWVTYSPLLNPSK